jgi:hypothetical protein
VKSAVEGGSTGCTAPYVLHLLLHASYDPDAPDAPAEPGILQFHSAQVELMTSESQTIVFDRGDALPNPFLVTTNGSLSFDALEHAGDGIVAIETIPVDYAAQLDSFVDGQILARVQVLGTTTTDVDVELEPFVYPIELCSGCLQVCQSELTRNGSSEEDVYAGECPDNAGADGRICIDPGC